MRKAEIDALVRAHRGRARPVAFFHVLRQTTLEPDDHAFLTEHIDELGASDLIRWRARCERGFTLPVIRQLARMARRDPEDFEHEVLNVPRLELEEDEWIELAELVKGQVPAAIHEKILGRCRREPRPRADGFMFTPGVIPTPNLDDDGLPIFREGGDRGTPDHPSMRELLLARRAGGLDEAAFVALANARAPISNEDWSFAVRELPAAMRDAVLEKARRTSLRNERANLLEWLGANGVQRGPLLEIALGAIDEGDVSTGIVAWLTRQLGTRAAWDRYGLAIVSALMAKRAFPEIGERVTVSWSEAARDAAEPPRRFLEAIQVVFSLALVAVVREALARDDRPAAMAGLSALACLDPPSRVSRAVHDLRRAAPATGDVADLIAVNERLVKHSDARDATLEGVIAALHAIADASG